MVTGVENRKRALEDLEIAATLALPLSFICSFLLLTAPCLLKDKICNPFPFFSAYVLGFVIGYLISDKVLHMMEWIKDERKEPDMAKGKKGIMFAVISIIVGYIIGIINSYLCVCITGVPYSIYDIVRGWGVIVGGAGFCGFLGGWAFKAKRALLYVSF